MSTAETSMVPFTRTGPAALELLCEPRALPATLDGRGKLAKSIATYDGFLTVATAIFLASTRDAFFSDPDDAHKFMDWIRLHFGREISPAHLHHMIAVGRLLLASKDTPVLCTTLVKLRFDKLLAISRLPREKLAAFIEQYGPALESASRDDVRGMVDEYVPTGRQRKPAPPPPAPGPLDIALGMVEFPPDRLYQTADCLKNDQSLRLLKNAIAIAERHADHGQYSAQDLLDAMTVVKGWFKRIIPLAKLAGIEIV